MEIIERNFVSGDWVTLVFIIALLLIAFMKICNPQLLLGYSIALFSQGFIEERCDKKPSVFSIFHIFLFSFSLIIFSLTVHFILSDYESLYTNTYLSIFFYLLIFIIVRYLLSKIIIQTLDIEERTRYFIFSKSGYFYAINLWLFPILILYQYGYSNIKILIIYAFLLLIFRLFLIIKNNKNLIFNNFFYFILYFCTFELAPLLIIYKATKN